MQRDVWIYGVEQTSGDIFTVEFCQMGKAKPAAANERNARLQNGVTRQLQMYAANKMDPIWIDFCERPPFGSANSEFPTSGLLIKRLNDKQPLLLIGSHISIIVSDVDDLFVPRAH